MTGWLSRLQLNSTGSILPLAAIALPVILTMVGSGLDMSRVYKARNRLQTACDAATLAGRRAVTNDGYDTDEQAVASTYFNTNFVESDVGATGTTFVSSSPDQGNFVVGSAETSVKMAVMGAMGFDTFDISVSCQATLGVGNSDITMVLDTTGSMGSTLSGTSQTRIQALRAAMKNFYDTLAMEASGSNARVRYSFVPYSSSVNVGRLIHDRDPNFLADQWPIQSREPVFRTINEQVFVGWNEPVYTSSENYSAEMSGPASQFSSTNYSSQTNCNSARPADTAWTDNGATSENSSTTSNSGRQVVTTTTTQPQIRTRYTCQRTNNDGRPWRVFSYYVTRNFLTYQYATSDAIFETRTRQEFSNWAYKQVNFSTVDYKRFAPATVNNGANGTPISYTWNGCIEERDTVATGSVSYSNLLGMSPSDAQDLNIDKLPQDGDEATKWGPMWPELAYYRLNSYNNLTNEPETTRGTKAQSFCPQRAQLLQEMEQSSFYNYADSLVAAGSTYHDLGLMWGLRLNSPEGPWQELVNATPTNGAKVARHIIFMTDGMMEPNYAIQSTYGVEWLDRRITDDGYSNLAARHTARFRALCDVAKAKGFRVWVIAFASSFTSDLTYCASSNSSFFATNATQLNSAFQDIAKSVGELRVYQ